MTRRTEPELTITITSTSDREVVCRIAPGDDWPRSQRVSWTVLREEAGQSSLYASILADARRHARGFGQIEIQHHIPTAWDGMWSGPHDLAPSPIGPSQALWIDPDGVALSYEASRGVEAATRAA